MKLFFAIKRLAASSGGAERVICAICSELVGRGHDVYLITFDEPGCKTFYPLDSRVIRIDLNIGDSSRSARLSESLKRMKSLREIVITKQPDLVVGFMHSMFIPLAIATAGSGIPVIGSEHIVMEHYRTRPLQYLMLILASPLLKKITVLSKTIQEEYPRSIKRKMVPISNPIAIKASVANRSTDKEFFTILNVGRLEHQKDQVTLIYAFSEITHKFPEWRLKILGEGSLRTDLEKLIKVLKLNQVVSMPGITDSIDDEYTKADLFITSSRYEAFGLATAEAMSHGLCAVGFADCSGTNELIDNGKTGFLVVPGKNRIDSLALVLSQLISNSALRNSIGLKGRETIEKKLSLSKICDEWEKLFFSIMKVR